MAKKKKSGSKGKRPSGLAPKTFKGMSPKRFKGRGGGGSQNWRKRVPLKKGSTIALQFLDEPEEFEEYEVHAWRENGRWNFVPCAGAEDCPLCASDDEQQRRTSYRFAANVYNLEAKKVQVLEGGSNLATVVHNRYSRGPSKWLKRVFDVTMFPTQPVSFQCELSEEDPLASSKLRKLEKLDLLEYIVGEMKEYYGDDLSNVEATRTSLDDDDEEEDDDEEGDLYDEDDLADMERSELVKIAKSLKIKTTDSEGEKRSKKTLIRLILKKQ